MRFLLECGKRIFWNVILSPHSYNVGESRPMGLIRKRTPFVLVLLFLLPGAEFAAKAQDLTGQWTGASTNSLSEKKQKIVLNIASGDSIFAGVLHWYYPEIQYFRNFIVRGQFHSKDSTVSIREDSLGDREPEEEAGKGPYILYYKRSGHKEVLEGHWSVPAGLRTGNVAEPGETLTIRLEKKAPAFIPLPPLPPHKKRFHPAKAIDSPQRKRNAPDHGRTRSGYTGFSEDRII